jgi:endonuclease/exonuclease/phosphatase family metal-dependent hydrolase
LDIETPQLGETVDTRDMPRRIRRGCKCSSGRVVLLVNVFVTFLTTACVRAEANVPGHVYSVLSYNVHGLFRLVAKDNPAERSTAIGRFASPYDIVLLQEDFEYGDTIAAQMGNSARFRGNGMGWDPRRIAAKALLFPLQLLIPHFSPPYGAGITTFVGADLTATSDVARESYTDCSGWLGGTGDCWANKGFLRVRIRTPEGGEVDVYNTHLEAGASETSVAIRAKQFSQLASRIETWSPGRAIIVSGDFNSDLRGPGDWTNLMNFRDRLGLQDSGAGPELPYWRERDYILYRNGTDFSLTVEEAGEALEFTNRHRALSDHPALFARFRVTRTP